MLADAIMRLGYEYATKAGISINVHDMTIPAEKASILGEAHKEVAKITEEYNEGSITDGERYNKIVDVWAQTNEKLTKVVIERISTQTFTSEDKKEQTNAPSFNSLFMMADSGARGSTQQIRQLGGMRGLMAKPSGEIIETPITSNFREGLSVLEYFTSTHGARKGLADTALKTANSGYLTRRLVDVAQDGIIRTVDCGATDGITLTSRIEAGEVVEHVADRAMGRVTAQAILGADGAELYPRNHLLTEKDQKTLKDNEVDQIKVRSVLTCKERHGFCAHCFGRDLARGKLVSIGETVGVIAAQSIGEPGTQLTMRTFHVGGTATAGAQVNKTEVRTAGILHLENVQFVKNAEGVIIVMNKNGEAIIKDARGVEKERYPVVYSSKLFFTHGQEVSVGDRILEWDPFAIPVLTEVSGTVKYEDLIVGSTVNEQVDAVTGLAHKVVTESKNPSLQPRLVIVDDNGNPILVPGTKRYAAYRLQVGANIIVNDGDKVDVGSALSKVQRETTKTKDITGGLPRVAELFEARKPTNAAQIADISGTIEFGSELRGNRRIIIRPEDGGEPMTYVVPKGRYVVVNEGDYIRAGEPIMDGPSNPHDILRVLGVKALARYIVDEIQEVYRLQGVKIDDKHIEVIVSQMLKKVEIASPGDSHLVSGDSITRGELAEINEKLIAAGEQPAEAAPLLLGITKASLTTDSFLSAASFQETTKVLTQAALEGKSDTLLGLKENVLMGRLIPAGSGIPRYRNYEAVTVEDEIVKSATLSF
jgi:DNA-directed RNA polymerase subunit beta'